VKIWRFENSKQGIEVGVRASERGLDMISLFTKVTPNTTHSGRQ